MSLDFLKNKKFLCFVGGFFTATLGAKALKSATVRKTCVKGLAKGMQLQNDARETLQNMKEDAEDICYDAKQVAEE